MFALMHDTPSLQLADVDEILENEKNHTPIPEFAATLSLSGIVQRNANRLSAGIGPS